MTKRFCNRCEKEIGDYEVWTVSVTFSNDPKPPIEPRNANDLCGECVLPALALIVEARDGLEEAA